jgi:serine/threonine protein kinase
MIGQTLNNRCKIISLLGEGGMGEVNLIPDEQTGHDLAIKILARQLTLQPESLERIRNEQKRYTLSL